MHADHPPDRAELFDRWAPTYDPALPSEDAEFPFAGYAGVLDTVVRLASAGPGMSVLDLGAGTGNLTARFSALDCRTWAVDFSAEMLARTRMNVPTATLVQCDIRCQWPPTLAGPFDRLVSAYLFHEFDLAAKMDLVQAIARDRLAQGGRIVIGDVAFVTTADRDAARQRWSHAWDPHEHYWAADETADACGSMALRVEFAAVSACGGVFVFEPV